MKAAQPVPERRWQRAAGIAFGIGTQVLFAATAWRLFWYLRDGVPATSLHWLGVDALLALVFAVPHSILLMPSVKSRITRTLPSGLYGSLFCLATCTSLWLIFPFWRGASGSVWSVDGVAAMLVPTLAYPITVSFLGQLDWGPVIGGYVGALFLGAAFSAIGLFVSSLTRNQIIAFILGMLICFALTLFDIIVFFLPPPFLDVIHYLGVNFHFQNIAKGIIDTRDILYFLSISFISLYGAHLVMEERH